MGHHVARPSTAIGRLFQVFVQILDGHDIHSIVTAIEQLLIQRQHPLVGRSFNLLQQSVQSLYTAQVLQAGMVRPMPDRTFLAVAAGLFLPRHFEFRNGCRGGSSPQDAELRIVFLFSYPQDLVAAGSSKGDEVDFAFSCNRIFFPPPFE